MVLNLIHNYALNIPYIIDTVPNYPVGYKLTDQLNNNVWIVEIYGEERSLGDQTPPI